MKTIVRETRETRVEIGLARGAGGPGGDVRASSATGLPFLDHMMTTLAFYAGLHLALAAKGDLRHHLVEDVAIAAGEAVARLVPERARRYGSRTLPMDDALVHVALDLGGRPYYEGPLPAPLYDHWFRSFAMQARATLHVRLLRGTDRHHVVEAAFKALGLSLREALEEAGPRFSTKGAVRWEDGSC
jgi:imidazoleglycerol-phosphate dehydratase